MKAYVITTGIIFGLIVVAHILRMVSENPQLARDPGYIAITGAAAALCLWALGLVIRKPTPTA